MVAGVGGWWDGEGIMEDGRGGDCSGRMQGLNRDDAGKKQGLGAKAGRVQGPNKLKGRVRVEVTGCNQGTDAQLERDVTDQGEV
jgi:hypothetical protein